MADLYLGNTGIQANSISPVSGSTININGVVISASSIVSGQSVQTQNRFNATLSGNTAGVMAQVSSGTLTLAGGNNITLSQNGNAVTISGGAGGGSFNLSAGTTSNNLTNAVFSNSNGVSFGLNGSTITASHNGLTTAAQSNQVVNSLNGSTGQLSLATGSSLSSSSNGSTITFGLASNITTALQSAGAYLTTARASTDAVGLNTAATNVTWTVNSSGISLNAGAYLTTAAASNHSHGNPSLALTNLSGTTASNSAGLTLSLSAGNYLTTAMASNAGSNFVQANAAFAGTNASGTIASNGISVSVNAGGAVPAASASNGSFTFNTLGFSNANNVTFGTSAGSIITASVAAPGAAAENNWVNLLGANTAGNTTVSGSTIGLSGINVTLSGTDGSVINVSGPSDLTLSYFNPQDAYVQVAGQQGQGTLHIQPMQAPNVQFDRLMMPIVNTNSSNSSGSHTLSFWAGIYTRNNSTLSLLHSASTSTAVTHSGTAGSYSLMSGMRLLSMGFTQTLTGGQYWVGIISRTTSGGANGSYSQMLASQVNSSFFGLFGESVNSTYQYTRGLGTYSATTNDIPSSIGFSQIRGASNTLVLRQPIFYLVSGTV